MRIRNGKASTPEALLERIERRRPADVLAGSARELKPAVERLLGLPFAHFTKCVVLPQGEFARFLHDEPAKRRDLLTQLLDLEVYDRIGALARQRAAAAKSAVEIHERQLAAFAGATEDARAAAEVRRGELLELHHALDAARPEDQRLVAAIAEADAQARAASALAAELDQIRVPRAVTQLTEKLDGALVAAPRRDRSGRDGATRARRARRRGRVPPRPRRARTGPATRTSRSPRSAPRSTTRAPPKPPPRPTPNASPTSRRGPKRISRISRSGSPRCATRTPRHALAGAPRRGRAVPGVPADRHRRPEAEAPGRAHQGRG